MPADRKTGSAKTTARTLAAFVTALVLQAAGGCVIILPALPINAPGYGQTYKVLDGDGRAIDSGLLVMKSVYEMAPTMLNCYDIDSGRAAAPRKVAIRYGGSLWGPIYTPPIGYFGMFHNPKFTTLLPLVPGYVPAWHIEPLQQPFVDGLHPPPASIRMLKAEADAEREYLKSCSYCLSDDPRQTPQDTAAQKRAVDYVNERLIQLQPPRPAKNGRPADTSHSARDAGKGEE
ncbi:MAG: hypothetical protein ACYTF6_15135 [Planctomycetota bacterium]|jgi:hypothetical protein